MIRLGAECHPALRQCHMLWRALWHGILPPRCPICDKVVPAGQLVCASCQIALAAIRWRPDGHCQTCAEPSPATSCGRCLSSPPSFQQCVAAYPYAEPVADLIQRLKYGHDFTALPPMADSLCAAGVAYLPDVERPDAIVPVPLHPKRLRSRGFNQSLELARPLARHLGIRLRPELAERRIDTASQANLSLQDRQRNVQNAFSASPRVFGLRILIVDDVMTTGATADALSQALLRAGAKDVRLLVLARRGHTGPGG